MNDWKIYIKDEPSECHLSIPINVEIFPSSYPEIMSFNRHVFEKPVYILRSDARIIIPTFFSTTCERGFFYGEFSSAITSDKHDLYKTNFYIDFDNETEKIKFKLKYL